MGDLEVQYNKLAEEKNELADDYDELLKENSKNIDDYNDLLEDNGTLEAKLEKQETEDKLLRR